jgi:LPXTG-motif cell wall-anchored protein
MNTTMRHRGRALAASAAITALALGAVMATPAGADTVGAGEASAFGATISLGGQEVVPPTPLAEATLPGDASETVVDIPAEPLAVSGTLHASASVHAASDIASELEVVTQAVEGPYNASAVGLIEGAEVLIDAVADDVSLVMADVIRAEAVAVCTGDTVHYAANSEIVSLQIGGEDVPLNEPLTQILDGLNDVLEQSGLNQVVDIQRNVVTELDDGIAVDALVVTVLAAAGATPLGEVRLGHAEVSGVACGAAPQCSDGVDNDDPEDSLADADDPGCHTDGDATNPDSYDPTDDSELDAPAQLPASGDAAAPVAQQLPSTGGDAATTAGLAGVLGAGALGLLALRRRLT